MYAGLQVPTVFVDEEIEGLEKEEVLELADFAFYSIFLNKNPDGHGCPSVLNTS